MTFNLDFKKNSPLKENMVWKKIIYMRKSLRGSIVVKRSVLKPECPYFIPILGTP